MNNKKIINGFFILTGSQALSYALSFVRTVIIARILSRADFGLAATFIIVVGIMEVNNKMALGKQVIQASDGDTAIFISTAHSFQLISATITGGMLLISSIPLAHIFNVPEKSWAFALISLSLLFKGFENLDYNRRQRNFEYMPTAMVDIIPQIFITAAALPLVLWIRDFRVVILFIISKSFLSSVITHLISKRPYQLGWNKPIAKRMWLFGWPLIVNGFLLFLAQQGDKALVGGGYSLDVLAIYAAAATLVTIPFILLANAAIGLFLPILSKLKENFFQFNKEFQLCLQFSAIGAVLAMSPFIIAGRSILTMVYGEKYSGGEFIIALLAAACAFRFIRIAPATAAMALADTKNQMLSNIFRLSSLIFGISSIVMGFSVEAVAVSMLIGDFSALCASTYRIKYIQQIPIGNTIKSIYYVSTCLITAGGLMWITKVYIHQLIVILIFTGIFLLLEVIFARIMFPTATIKIYSEIKKIIFTFFNRFCKNHEKV